MKRIFTLLIVGLFIASFIAGFAEEVKLENLINWVAQKMEVKLNQNIPLPSIKIVSQEEMDRRVVELMKQELGENSPYFKGFTPEEIVRVNREERGESFAGHYNPAKNEIFVVQYSPLEVLVEEVIHFIQCKYQHKYFDATEIAGASEEKLEEFLKINKQLDEEAARLIREWRSEHPRENLLH